MQKLINQIVAFFLFFVLWVMIFDCEVFADSLIFPNDLTIIEKEAFYGDSSIIEIMISEKTTTIGERAFAFSGLKTIYIPNSVITIGNDAFQGCRDLTIWCNADSYARNYADDYKINWVDISAYSSVIEKYRAAYLSGNANNEYWNEAYAYRNEISAYIGYSSHVGYALIDLNDDLIPELIIAGIDSRDFGSQELFDLYTLSEGKQINLATSYFRLRYYLTTDYSILFSGSGGAAYHQHAVKQVSKNQLIPKEAIFTYYSQDFNNPQNNHFGYYYQIGYTTYEPDKNSVELDEQTYLSMRNKYESSVYLPPLILIA